jgi:hypothetical protein
MLSSPADRQGHIRELSGFQGTDQDVNSLLSHYETILNIYWQAITPTLGRVTVTTVFDRALVRVGAQYPFNDTIELSATGVSVEKLRGELERHVFEDLHAGLDDLLEQLINIIDMLTGDILLRQIVVGLEGQNTHE